MVETGIQKIEPTLTVSAYQKIYKEDNNNNNNILMDKRDFLYLLMFYVILLVILDYPVNVYAVSGYYYAGYYYYGFTGSGRWGVESNIYTADMYNIPYGSEGMEWVTIVLSYYPRYWIQVGYIKRWVLGWTQIDYYVEVNSTKGYNIWYYSGPDVGTTHLYRIIDESAYSDPSNPIDPHYWIVKVDPNSVNPPVSKEVYVDPYEGVDMQAMIEIHDDTITVAISHFYNLKYYDAYSGWLLWNRHYPLCNYTFVLDEVSNHEFYAWTK